MTWRLRTAAVLCALYRLTTVGLAQTRPQAAHRPLSGPTRVCVGGDVTLGTNLDSAWAKKAADSLYRTFGLASQPDSLVVPLRPLLADCDVVILNIEGAIGDGWAPPKCGPRSTNCFAFRQPPAAAAALRSVIDSGAVLVGNLANNHSHDAGDDGRDTTVAYLERAGILVTGADTLATAVPTLFGDTLGVLGFHTDSTAPDARDLAAVRRHVARAVASYGTVIVTMHLGAEGPNAQRTRNGVERFLGLNRGNPVAFANAAFAGGATLVVGHGPHVLRGGEWRGDRLVLYSLGNLLTYGPFRLRPPADRAAVAHTVIDSAGHVAAAKLRPTTQLAPGVLQSDSTGRAFVLVDSLSALDFPRTGVRIASDGRIERRTSSRGAKRPAPKKAGRVSPWSAARSLEPRSCRRRGTGGAEHPSTP
jgi:poly-gamma-glutamate capsule biosynthesis protein CapA/YwtB (metallophosphatase superfamily)